MRTGRTAARVPTTLFPAVSFDPSGGHDTVVKLNFGSEPFKYRPENQDFAARMTEEELEDELSEDDEGYDGADGLEEWLEAEGGHEEYWDDQSDEGDEDDMQE